ncbi:hypothetical protein ACRAWF_40150 [Streptomyces sp. L7]
MGFPTEDVHGLLFALGRLPGLDRPVARDDQGAGSRIGRPRQIYTGVVERDFVPVEGSPSCPPAAPLGPAGCSLRARWGRGRAVPRAPERQARCNTATQDGAPSTPTLRAPEANRASKKDGEEGALRRRSPHGPAVQGAFP